MINGTYICACARYDHVPSTRGSALRYSAELYFREMAEPDNVQRLRSLLSQAVDCLGSTSNSPGPSFATGSSRSNSESGQGSAVFQADPRRVNAADLRRTAQIQSERNTLFNFGSRRSTITRRDGFLTRKRGPKSKKKKLPMWNHEFVCLASKNQEKTPTSFERSMLIAAGIE